MLSPSSIYDSSNKLEILYFDRDDDSLNKGERTGPNGYEAFRYVASAEIIDLEGDVIALNAIAEVMPIMQKQGSRLQGIHTNQPAGQWFDWGFMKYKGADAIWLDTEIYDDYPTQKEILRRIKLPKDHKECLTGLSLGGYKLEKEKRCDQMICWTHISKIEGWEFSPVPKPGNPLADNIEDQLTEMEIGIMSKEQPRDNSGRFAPISKTTVTTTEYDNSNWTYTGTVSTIKKDHDCGCPDKVKKAEGVPPKKEKEGKPSKPAPEDDVYADGDPAEDNVGEEEVYPEEEAAEGEIDAMDGEPGMEEEGMGEEGDMAEEANDPAEILSQIYDTVKTMQTAMGIDPVNKGSKKMTEKNEIEVDGKTYVLKKEEAAPAVEETETDPVTELRKEFETKFNTLMEALDEKLQKGAVVTTEVSGNITNPADVEEVEATPIIAKSNISFEDRARLIVKQYEGLVN